MKAVLYVAFLLFSFSLGAQVIRPKEVKRPKVKKVDPRVVNPSIKNSMKVIKSGELYVRNGAQSYTTTTLPSGKVLVAWSNYKAKGEATFYTPTLSPYTPVIYTDNNYEHEVAISQQKAVTFANGNVLIVYFNRYKIARMKFDLRLMYVVFDKDGKLIRNPTQIDFKPKARNGLVGLSIGKHPKRAYVYFTEKYMETFRNGSNENYDTYFFATNETGKISEPVKKVLSGYNDFAPWPVSVSKDPSGGIFMGLRKRDLFVEYYHGPGNYSPDWKVQVTRNVYDINLVAVHGHKDRKALILYTEGKTGIQNNDRLVYQIVGEDGAGEKIAITDEPVKSHMVKSLSLKDGSVFVSVISGPSSKKAKATGWLIDPNGVLTKGPFQFIDEFKYWKEDFDMTQLINGQVFVIYKGSDSKPRYVVISQ